MTIKEQGEKGNKSIGLKQDEFNARKGKRERVVRVI